MGSVSFQALQQGGLAALAPKEARPCDSSQTRFLLTSKRDVQGEDASIQEGGKSGQVIVMTPENVCYSSRGDTKLWFV